MAVMTIHTDEGIAGHNFISGPGPSPSTIAEQISTVVKPMLVGRDPLDVGAIWTSLWQRRRSLHETVIGFIDVALWDIVGKVAGLPIHRLLGTCREALPAYASSFVYSDVADYGEDALAYAAMGFAAYKLHPPTQWRLMARPPRDVAIVEDIRACTEVRRVMGDDYKLMLDSAWAYSYMEALEVGRAIEALGYYWYEDPLQPDDIYGYARLKRELDIPLMATEITGGGPYSYVPWLTEKATDFLRGDPVVKAGITGLMKIVHLAETFGMNCEIHDGYNALNNVACLHVCMATNNCEFFEILVKHPPNIYNLDSLSYGLTSAIEIDNDGMVHAPTGPGLGFEIDWDRIKSGARS